VTLEEKANVFVLESEESLILVVFFHYCNYCCLIRGVMCVRRFIGSVLIITIQSVKLTIAFPFSLI